jgi:hypothetical protein
MEERPRSHRSRRSAAAAQEWTWAQVWRRRLARHSLLRPAAAGLMVDVVGQVCGIHAQVAASAELSLGLRIEGITRQDVATALWQERSLVKTYSLRGTLHLFPSRELSLWIAALRARVPSREPTQQELRALPAHRKAEMVEAILVALEGQQLTREELAEYIERRIGGWATEAAFPAFGGHFPRWQRALHQASLDGLIVAGPPRGNRVTYARTEDWLGKLEPVDGQTALRKVCLRFLEAYGPATHVEFARWFYTRSSAARELMESMDLEAVDVEGWRAWMPRGATPDAGSVPHSEVPRVHLLPQFDCFVVGSFPREQLIPETAPAALRGGTAAPFAVVLVDGVVGGLWDRRKRGGQLEVRVHTFVALDSAQEREVERQVQRVGEIQQTRAALSFGHIEARGHL